MRSRCSDEDCGSFAFEDESVPVPGGALPTCACGKPLRPDVVLFGEPVPAYSMARQVVRDAEVLLAVGTSGQVQPAVGLIGMAATFGAYCVLVNAEPWEHPDPHIAAELIGPAEEILPALVAAVRGNGRA
jgi:NAD-dependent deacetylase